MGFVSVEYSVACGLLEKRPITVNELASPQMNRFISAVTGDQ